LRVSSFYRFLVLNDIEYSAYSIIRGVLIAVTRVQWVTGSLFAGVTRLT
jgi:hypothetical protein